MKAKRAQDAVRLTDIPNVGPRIAADFFLLGVQKPQDLSTQDPYLLYKKLERITGVRHDPCVLDTYMAVIDFMNGAPTHPWFWYTKKRKKLYGQGK